MIITIRELEEAKNNNTLEAFILRIIKKYLESEEYQALLLAEKYYRGEYLPPETIRDTIVQIDRINRGINLRTKIAIPSGIFRRVVTIQVSRLWYNPVQFDDETIRMALGEDFDDTAESIATWAAVHGVAYGFWNYSYLHMFKAIEYFPIVDERTGGHMAGVRFKSIGNDKKNNITMIQLYEIDGWTEWKQYGENNMVLEQEKQPYTLKIRRDALGVQVVAGENYPGFPVLPCYANSLQMSELFEPIRRNIDLYAAHITKFGDAAMRYIDPFWIFQGFTGQLNELREMRAIIENSHIISPTDDAKSEVTQVLLQLQQNIDYMEKLEDNIFTEAMITNPKKISGGNITATAIDGTFYVEKMKIADMEKQGLKFIRRLLRLIGIESKKIEFKHETISSDMEITQRLNMYSELDLETKLIKDPLFVQDEIPEILERVAIAQLSMPKEPIEDDGLRDGADGRQNEDAGQTPSGNI